MKLKRIMKYVFLLVLLGFMGFLYGFSNHRNTQKIIKKTAVKFYSNESYFLTQTMVNKLLIQNKEYY